MRKMTSLDERKDEQRARRMAIRHGLIARKSRRSNTLVNQGGFMLVDPTTNIPLAGFTYELSPADVIEHCTG